MNKKRDYNGAIRSTTDTVVNLIFLQMRMFGVRKTSELPNKASDEFSLGYILGLLWSNLSLFQIKDRDILFRASKKTYRKIYGWPAITMNTIVKGYIRDNDPIFYEGLYFGIDEMEKYLNEGKPIAGWIYYVKGLDYS